MFRILYGAAIAGLVLAAAAVIYTLTVAAAAAYKVLEIISTAGA